MRAAVETECLLTCVIRHLSLGLDRANREALWPPDVMSLGTEELDQHHSTG